MNTKNIFRCLRISISCFCFALNNSELIIIVTTKMTDFSCRSWIVIILNLLAKSNCRWKCKIKNDLECFFFQIITKLTLLSRGSLRCPMPLTILMGTMSPAISWISLCCMSLMAGCEGGSALAQVPAPFRDDLNNQMIPLRYKKKKFQITQQLKFAKIWRILKLGFVETNLKNQWANILANFFGKLRKKIDFSHSVFF